MSSPKQRSMSAYQLGRQDAKEGRLPRYKRHPFFRSYKKGYYDGGLELIRDVEVKSNHKNRS